MSARKDTFNGIGTALTGGVQGATYARLSVLHESHSKENRYTFHTIHARASVACATAAWMKEKLR